MLFLSAVVRSTPEHNVVNTVRAIIKILDINISLSTIRETLEEHPAYPSLLSISDSLISWNVNNIAFKTDIEQLKNSPLPFVVQLQQDDQLYFTVVRSIKDGFFSLSAIDKLTWTDVSAQSFEKQWKGVVMLVEKEKHIRDKHYSENQKVSLVRQFAPWLAALFVLITAAYQTSLYWIQIGATAFFGSAILLVKLFGSYVTGLLLWYEIDKDNSGIKKVCATSKKSNCETVLKSAGARIWGISWSEIGFIYFSGSTLLLLSDLTKTNLYLLAWLNIFALPYTLYSIYYQWQIVKQWCTLCLTIQALLIAELILNIIGNGGINISTLSILDFIRYLTHFSIPILGWVILKPILLSGKNNKIIKKELLRIKYDKQIFNSILSKRRKYATDPVGLGITIGNLNASIKLVKVCNPFCGPCAKAHPELEELINSITNLQVQIIFTTSNSDLDQGAMPVKHLLAIAEKNDVTHTKQALDDWYNASKKDYAQFAEKYKMDTQLKDQNSKLEAMHHWCRESKITHTPTFFLQGFELPDLYSIKDLKFLISN